MSDDTQDLDELTGMSHGAERSLAGIGTVTTYRKNATDDSGTRPFGYYVALDFEAELESPGYGAEAARVLAGELRRAAAQVEECSARLGALSDVWGVV